MFRRTDKKGVHRLLNVPSIAEGYALNDEVKVKKDGSGELLVTGLHRPGGHSTIHAAFNTDRDISGLMKKLKDAGYNVEGHKQAGIIAIDIPPQLPVAKAVEILESVSLAGYGPGV